MKLYNILFEEHRHGNVHGDFLNQESDKKEELLLKLGVPQNKLLEYLAKLESLITQEKTITGKAINKSNICCY